MAALSTAQTNTSFMPSSQSVTTASPMALLHSALSKPLTLRCADITKLLETANLKELHNLLPTLLDSIFGFNAHPGWGIHKLTSSYHYDYSAVRQLLAPEGPLFSLIYKLLQDPYARYDFPMSCIPFPSRASIHQGGVPAFYTSKLQGIPGQSQPGPALSLNAFEYYFFHFSYLLVSPMVRKMSLWSSNLDSLYPMLVEDYLSYFLPLTGRGVPSVITNTPQIRSPVSQHSPAHRPSPMRSPSVRTMPPGRGSYSPLLRTQTPPQRQIQSQHLETAEPEMWRSQTLVQILVEFWLNQHNIENGKFNFSHQKTYEADLWYRGSIYRDPMSMLLTESSLPSSDHVRIVRLFVKHLHYFSNTARPDLVTSPYQGHIISPIDEFKRSVIPQLVQKRLYTFLRHGFEHWPLDSQFRLLLETWLSYIQPWRYTDVSQKNAVAQDTDIKERVIENKWIQFIGENLLFYTVLFHNFLSRMFRVDLASPKNAQMLFRVSKVYGLPNLSDLIQEVEDTVLDVYGRGNRSNTTLNADVGGSYLSMLPQHGTKVTASLQMLIVELEGPAFVYQPFFCPDTNQLIEELLRMITEAQASIQTNMEKIKESGSGSFWSLFGFGSDYNASRIVSGDGYDDYSPGDIKKAQAHLEQALNNFCCIFKLSAPQNNKSVTWGRPKSNSSDPDSLKPDMMETDAGSKLSPLGRYQLMNGLRKFDVDYQCDPELQPIRSFESAVLVRMFYHLSSYVNTNFSKDIQRLNEREDFIARVASQFFTTPKYKMKSRSPPLSPKQEELAHTPRLSLRWLASYQNLGYLLAFYLFMYMWWGLGFVGFGFLLFLLTLVYGVLKAIFVPKRKMKSS